jgi:hypothetical protein
MPGVDVGPVVDPLHVFHSLHSEVVIADLAEQGKLSLSLGELKAKAPAGAGRITQVRGREVEGTEDPERPGTLDLIFLFRRVLRVKGSGGEGSQEEECDTLHEDLSDSVRR